MSVKKEKSKKRKESMCLWKNRYIQKSMPWKTGRSDICGGKDKTEKPEKALSYMNFAAV